MTAADRRTDRFVGREAECGEVLAAMDAVRLGEPRIVWIEGESGIGKTALLRRCLSSARDMLVLTASGDESETTLDYGVVAQLLAHVDAAPDPASGPANPFSVGAELLALLGSLQDRAAVLIAIDDAQWMDARSAAALLFALRRLHGDRVLVLIASRPESLEALGASWPRLLADGDRVRRIGLGGLSAAEVQALAGPALTAAAAERLRAHTEGHPLYVRALLRELTPESLNRAPGALPAPRSFAATVLGRVGELADDARGLLTAAAVAGERCRLDRAGVVAGLEDPFTAVEGALRADLLVLDHDRLPEEIAFPHPLIRAAVRDDLPPARRSALHLRWARLADAGEALGHRAAASHGADDALAAELQATAEAEIATGRLAAGVEHLLAASRIAASRDRRELALLRAVECLLLTGDVPAATSRRDEVLACADGPRRSFTIGALTASIGALPQAEATFREVVARPDFAEHVDLEGPVTSALALVCALHGNHEESIAWAQRALEAAASTPTAIVTARQAKALGLTMSGRAPAAIAELGDVSATRTDPGPFEPELLATRGQIELWWGDLERAIEDLSTVLRWSRSGAAVRSLPNAYSALAGAEYHLGCWDAGLAHAELAITLGEDAARSWDLPFMYAVAAALDAGRGSWERAERHRDAAAAAAARVPTPASGYHARAAVAHLAWVRTEWEAVLVALEALPRAPAQPPLGMGYRLPRLMRVEALIATQRLDEARAELHELDLAGAARSDVTRLEHRRLRGVLAQALGEIDEAAAAFAPGAGNGSPFYAALFALSHGHWRRQRGQRREAIAILRTARAGFEQLGAAPFVGRCDAELAGCGVRERRDGDRYGLTAREEVVARLVASGKTNREIAEELYLSTKAIEYHLSNVFAKIGVRSRYELAARLNASATR
ncbi:MAG: AAA family ATPase [Solirubrobacterales bacterium]|nr:AAA family ATPase [Solirubrobacterales bacterium]